MKKALLVSQSQDGSFINILHNSLKQFDFSLTVISGKLTPDIDKSVICISSVRYDSRSFLRRFVTWNMYVNDVNKYLKKTICEYDLVIFTSNPPINQKLVQFVQSKKKKTIYLVWDIYPNTIEIAFGRITCSLSAIWRRKNRNIYRNCNQLITIGEVMKGILEEDYPDANICVIPYHTDTSFIRPINPEDNFFLKDNKLEGKCVFMYSGKMGYGHGFNDIIQSAKMLKDRKDISFVLIGFGAAYEETKRIVAENCLFNVKVLPYQPLEVLPYSLSAASVSFITIKQGYDGLFLPSKLYDALASGSAIICISEGNNDVSRMIEMNNIGVNVKPGDSLSLTNEIRRMVNNPGLLFQYKKRSREIAKMYDVKNIIQRYEHIFGRIL